MRWWHRLRARIRNLVFRAQVDRDLEHELASYLDLVADERQTTGAPEIARRDARVSVGSAASVTDAVRAARAGAGLEQLGRDVRDAFRSLRRTPGYTALAIVLLTLAIGATAVVFAVADAAMFKPLPYRDPDQLVQIVDVFNRGTYQMTFQLGTTWPEVERWRAETTLFSSLSTFSGPETMKVTSPSGTEVLPVSRIAPDMIDLLGVAPRLGRAFVAADARGDGRVVLLAEGFWRRAFQADPLVLGHTLALNGQDYAIVGVMPATLSWGVGSTTAPMAAWVPLDEFAARADTARPLIGSIARLRPAMPFDRAREALIQARDRLQVGRPGDQRWDVDLVRLDRRVGSRDATRTSLVVLFVAVGVVLLIACANVGNVLLTRALARGRELAVRAALGATRGRLAWQGVVEGAVLAVCGGVCALVLVTWAVGVVPAFVPEGLQLFAANPLTIDVRVLAFCATAVVLTAVLCGGVPAWQVSRVDLVRALESGPRTAGPSPAGRRLRVMLQTVQIAFSVVLLTGAGLLGTSFVRMIDAPPGYDLKRLATVGLSLPADRYATVAARDAFFDRLLGRVRALDGVQATYGQPPPDAMWGVFTAFGREHDHVRSGLVSLHVVDPDYLAIAGIPLRAGRSLEAADTHTSPAVAVIDERAAALYWPGQAAMGRQFRYFPNGPWVTVVGVVGSIKTREFASTDGTIQAYLPRAQSPSASTPYRDLLLRAEGDPTRVLAPVRAIIHALDPAIEPDPMSRVADLYRADYIGPRFFLGLMILLASLALVTSAMGLYGVLSYAVGQRTHEIGVRLALGADPRRLRQLVVRDALIPVVAGVGIGLVGSFWLTRYLRALLYGITPHDPRAFATALALVVLVAAVALWPPARRATRVDPVATLRVG